jgi:hypothetical protein
MKMIDEDDGQFDRAAVYCSTKGFGMSALIIVRATWDPEAEVWWTESSDLAGLNAEAPTLEALRDKLPPVISDLIRENEPALRGTDIVVEIVAHTHTRVPAVA